MIVNVANPIYDAVFKYLVEDERIAKILLSALLRKNVVEVELRPHEYSNVVRDNISMFRIDFGAKVREEDGTVRLVLVELQKTWVETETLRFRQYLGAHYLNPKNMQKEQGDAEEEEDSGMVKEERPGRYAIPMITIYLLGHKVGDIEEPVIYVNHDVLDYYGKPVTTGIPDPFVNSLVHDSIIVQIPRLRGQVNNRLDMVLSIFDQTNKDGLDHQMLAIEDSKYKGDPEMEHILHRLLMAATNHDLRLEMNVEDEFFKAIEDRDTAIMNRDRRLKEQEQQISEQSQQISEQSQQISEQSQQLSEQSQQLSEQSQQLSEQSQQISEQEDTIKQQQMMINTMVHSMIDRGMNVNEIAMILNKTPEEINSLLGSI